MHHMVRKLILFPLMLIGSPVLYFVGWCDDGHKIAWIDTLDFLKSVWYGTLADKG